MLKMLEDSHIKIRSNGLNKIDGETIKDNGSCPLSTIAERI